MNALMNALDEWMYIFMDGCMDGCIRRHLLYACVDVSQFECSCILCVIVC